ncbi:glucose/arabinose dehydrogenase [Luteibacter sp. Sphag1AF]|uniref:PQQ-dependent sugar dehydrogenase n=1 Tax=Luteibacter sp. Sphag1AF TaxID=2587031 RepID=UPI00161BEB21|nr:sorbosone dehydrogenase family protein [Luteibacter sp. Sphag1AF]MBB3228107.1 glucose/arabinose dehydrogenase [Luteibacter sp. Sphag1AF]
MNNAFCRSILTLACVAALGACSDKATFEPAQQSGSHPTLPAPRNFLMPPMQVPDKAGWKDGQMPTVAPGLNIEKVADGFMHPRQLYVLPNDDVLVVESNGPGTEPVTTPKQFLAGMVKNQSGKGGKGGNRITLLRRNGNTWDKHLFIEHLNSPFGVQLIGDWLYVANTDGIVKFPYQAGETTITAPGTPFADLPSTINHHWTKSLLASPDGTKLYVGVGSNSNITENGLDVEYRRADVLEVDVATGASRIYAAGLRNPTGLQWEPTTGKLWAIVNERDEIGADLVPDYMTSVQDGGFYGWPYSYYGQHVDMRVKPQRPDLVAKALVPDYAIGSHVAPLGLLMSNGSVLSGKYQAGAFIAEHGSWDRSPLSGYEVVYVRFEGGKPVGLPETVISGFHSKDESKLYGAPVGLVEDKSGALLVADDVGDTVWRVTSTAP